MKASGYKLNGFTVKSVGGKEADGFIYDYAVQGTEMTGETFSLKNGNTYYYIHCYVRSALKNESFEIVDNILGTAKWK